MNNDSHNKAKTGTKKIHFNKDEVKNYVNITDSSQSLREEDYMIAQIKSLLGIQKKTTPNYFDYSAREKKRILNQAMFLACEDQRNMVKKYNEKRATN